MSWSSSPQTTEAVLGESRSAGTAVFPYAYGPLTHGLILLLTDCLAFFAIAMLFSWISASFWPKHEPLFAAGGTPPRWDFIIFAVAIIMYLAIRGQYSEPSPFWAQARLTVRAALGAIAAEGIFRMMGNEMASLNVVIGLLAFPVSAAALRFLSKQFSPAEFWQLPVVLITDRPEEAEAALPGCLYRFTEHISPDEVLAGCSRTRLRSVLDQNCARRLLIMTSGDRQRQLVQKALRERVPFILAPAWSIPAFPFEPIWFFGREALLVSFSEGISRRIALTMKVVFDVLVAAVLLVFLSPVFLILMLIIRLDGGPAFYVQKRFGAGGREFNCLKFRTMLLSADGALREALAKDPALAAEWSATRKLINDPRVTGIGRFLRKSSLDELPQLVNVLRLEMSLVGPRPIVDSEIPLYGREFARYCSVRPGITGLWQVSGRSSISYEKRVQLDVWYADNWSFWYDVIVLLKTIPAVFSRVGAH